MRLSARNQLPGTVESVELGTIMAEVVLDAGGSADREDVFVSYTDCAGSAAMLVFTPQQVG